MPARDEVAIHHDLTLGRVERALGGAKGSPRPTRHKTRWRLTRSLQAPYIRATTRGFTRGLTAAYTQLRSARLYARLTRGFTLGSRAAHARLTRR